MTKVKKRPCILSPSGLAILKSFSDDSTLFTFDLDGTLAPIMKDPSMIVIPDEVREKMARLSTVANIAILTGRARDDARSHLGFDPLFIIGNHGAEGIPGWEDREQGFADLCRGWEDQLTTLLPHASPDGIVIENKGASLSIHYRNTSKPKVTYRDILRAVQHLSPTPRRIPGKCVENILPEDSLNKGEALLQIMRHAGASKAVFVGDDDTDEDVFRMKHERILGIRVGDGLPSEANYCLCDQKQIDLLLDAILCALTKNLCVDTFGKLCNL